MVMMVLKLLLIFFCISGWLSSPNILAQQFAQEGDRSKVLAAPKGAPPPCNTLPGQTFCESVHEYPYELVLKAIKNTNFDISKFLVDESMDDGPDFGNINPGLTGGERETRSPSSPPQENSNRVHFLAEEGDGLNFIQHHNLTPEGILKRVPRNATSTTQRTKRQIPDNLIPVCQYRSRFVYPQAAMCARTGEWMYIINVRGLRGSLTQMIKTEVCNAGVDGKPCMIDSDLPIGIVSRCNQHYIQKRLIMLSGTELAADMFWLPSCCVCSTFNAAASNQDGSP